MGLPNYIKNTSAEILNHPLVQYLTSTNEKLTEQIEQFKAEIRLLKGHSPKPSIPPNSKMEGVKSSSEKEVKKNSLY